ncbi:unnamed protein product [Musa hybrid cultivar]
MDGESGLPSWFCFEDTQHNSDGSFDELQRKILKYIYIYIYIYQIQVHKLAGSLVFEGPIFLTAFNC